MNLRACFLLSLLLGVMPALGQGTTLSAVVLGSGGGVAASNCNKVVLSLGQLAIGRTSYRSSSSLGFWHVVADPRSGPAVQPIIGSWYVALGKNTALTGDALSGGNLYLQEGNRALPGQIAGSLSASGDIRLDRYNHVSGGVSAGGKVVLPAKKNASTVQIEGLLSEHSQVDPVVLPPLSFAVDPRGGAGVRVKKNETGELFPYEQSGQPYGEVKVEQHAVLTLHSGTYYLRRLTLSSYSELVLDLSGGPLTVNAEESLQLGHHTRVTLQGGDAEEVLFNIKGAGSLPDEADEAEDSDDWEDHDLQGRPDLTPNRAIRILHNSQFAGTIYAPQSKISVGHHSQIQGALIARQVRLNTQVVFTGQPACGLDLSGSGVRAKPLVAKALSASPQGFALQSNYPNPFNPSTTMRYTLSDFSEVRLAIYNALGQEIRELVRQVQGAGQYEVVWDGQDQRGEQVSSGMYFYKLEVGTAHAIGRMSLVK